MSLILITCYLIYSLCVGHSQRSNIKSFINTVIDESKKQKQIKTNEKSVDKREVLQLNKNNRNLRYQV